MTRRASNVGTRFGGRWAARGLAARGLHAALALWLASSAGPGACAGAQQSASTDQRVIEGERAYLRLPNDLFAGAVVAETVGPELLRCYESEAAGGAWDITQVQLELVWDGHNVRPRIAQHRTNLSERVALCVEQVTITWDLTPEVADTGTIYPVEFGPRE